MIAVKPGFVGLGWRVLIGRLGPIVLALALPVGILAAPGDSTASSQGPPEDPTVGMWGTLERIVLPGTELEPVPWTDRAAPVVVRITAVHPHGSALRYDISYCGLEPGEYDLRAFLQRRNGSSSEDLPAIPVRVRPVLPPGQIEPPGLARRPVPRVGGYRTLLVIAGIAWVAGLVAIFRVRRPRKSRDAADSLKPRTLADRIRPMVEEAIEGRITTNRQAELERLLVAAWRRELDLEGCSAAEAMAVLRSHEEAGRLLDQLDLWLHRRPDASAPVDLARLLAPYERMTGDAVGADSIATPIRGEGATFP